MRSSGISRAALTRTVTAMRSRWRASLIVVLILTILTQSMLTIACGLDELGAFGSDATTAAAEASSGLVHSDAGSTQDICVACGGLLTPSGCCAHAVVLSHGITQLPIVVSAPLTARAEVPSLPQDAPPDLFRPPILV